MKKSILGVLLGLSFDRIPLESVYEKSTTCKLVSNETNFVLPTVNIYQLLQIDVNYVFDSYCILITIFILKKMIFSFAFIENIRNNYSLKAIKTFQK